MKIMADSDSHRSEHAGHKEAQVSEWSNQHRSLYVDFSQDGRMELSYTLRKKFTQAVSEAASFQKVYQTFHYEGPEIKPN